VNPIHVALAVIVILAIGFGLGLLAELPFLREWKRTALEQAAVLHTDDRTPRHPFTAAGPDDLEARNRIGGRR
jgi:hypothetical protein